MSFLRKGKRQQENYKKKLIKLHTKEFYKALSRLDKVADYLKEANIEITEDNVNEEASKFIGRDLDNMEKFILLGKLGNYEKNIIK